MLLAYSWLSLALDLAQMVHDVRNNLKAPKLFVLKNFWFNSLAHKSSSEGVLALGLPLAIFGPGPGPDGP